MMEEQYVKSEEVMDVENSEPQDVTLEVTIPENSAAGERITIQCPDNTFVQFVTPDNVVAGDTVHVTVSDSSVTESGNESAAVERKAEGTSYQGVAAVTTGVIVSALVIGPIVTGVLVVGIVVCATQRQKTKATVASEPTEAEIMEGGAHVEEVDEDEQAKQAEVSSAPETREQKIAAALVKTADYIVDKWSAIDERFAISGNTLKAIATVQEMDERNKISETVVTSIKTFDEKYQVSETAGNLVTTTVTKAKELDESCKLTENVTNAGSNLALCMTDFERRYDISTRITTALIFTMTTLSEAITSYMNRIANGPAAASTTTGDPDTGATTQPGAPISMDAPLHAEPVDPALSSPTQQGSYLAPAVAV